MTNTQNIIGLFIVLVIILSMGLQFVNSREKEGFSNNNGKNSNNSKKNDNIPVQSKTNNSIAKQNMLNDTVPNY
jgi:hypothetical protein